MARNPGEFCGAMRDLVVRSQSSPATAVSDQAFEMKLKVLDFLLARSPGPEEFERMLLDRIGDADPQKELSRDVCCQILNSWQSGSFYYTAGGELVLRALYPADPPRVSAGARGEVEEA